jgi:hypothetical protein
VAGAIFPSCGLAGPWRPLAKEEQFLQGAEELEQAREGHGCLSSHRLDGPLDPAVGGPVDVEDELQSVQPLALWSRSDVTV